MPSYFCGGVYLQLYWLAIGLTEYSTIKWNIEELEKGLLWNFELQHVQSIVNVQVYILQYHIEQSENVIYEGN